VRSIWHSHDSTLNGRSGSKTDQQIVTIQLFDWAWSSTVPVSSLGVVVEMLVLVPADDVLRLSDAVITA
jgi:hypothetical protein